jgi:hypothetical protein
MKMEYQGVYGVFQPETPMTNRLDHNVQFHAVRRINRVMQTLSAVGTGDFWPSQLPRFLSHVSCVIYLVQYASILYVNVLILRYCALSMMMY